MRTFLIVLAIALAFGLYAGIYSRDFAPNVRHAVTKGWTPAHAGINPIGFAR